MAIYTEEDLMGMSVHTLRIILRENNGVPGILNKNELIRQILEIQSGEITPTRSSKGRKPLEGHLSPIGLDISFSDVEPENLNMASGYFDLHADGYGYIRKDFSTFSTADVFVSKAMAKSYCLLNGDFVEGNCEKNTATGVNSLSSVSFLNGKTAIQHSNRKTYGQLESCYTTDKIHLGKIGGGVFKIVDVICPLAKGQRCVVVDEGGNYKTDFIKKISEILPTSLNEKIEVLCVGVKPEELTEIKRLEGCLVTAVPINTPVDQAVRIINLFADSLKRSVESGKEKTVVIDGLSKVVSVYDEYLQSERKQSGYINLKSSGKAFAKDLLSYAGNYGEDGNLTVIATVQPEKDRDFCSELIDVATSVITLTDKNLAKRREYTVDVNSSWTVKDELLLNEREIEFSNEAREEVLKDESFNAKLYLKVRSLKEGEELI